MLQWERDAFRNVNVSLVSEYHVLKENEFLAERFSRPKVLPRKQSYDYAEVEGGGRIAVR